IGVTERMAYILRVRTMAVAIAKKWAGIEDPESGPRGAESGQRSTPSCGGIRASCISAPHPPSVSGATT
ncbi:MAG TPA: hypothetical protein VF147_04435, partial [Vicinamibacterales bacterium]